jgi:hypothetical protein
MCYPYLTSQKGLREKIIRNRVFVPTYWAQLVTEPDDGSLEHRLRRDLVPLPIDQRYGREHMNRILELIDEG